MHNSIEGDAMSAEVAEITRTTLLMVEEMTAMVFDRTVSDRERRQVLDIIGAALGAVSFGLALSNKYEINEFRVRMHVCANRVHYFNTVLSM